MSLDDATDVDRIADARRFTRRQIVSGLGILGIGALAGMAIRRPSPASDQVADPAIRNLEFLSDNGEIKKLVDFEGVPLVVNFFAGWCPPCRAELPDFEKVHLVNRDQIKFLGISHDLDETGWRALIAETGVTFETGFQPSAELWTALGAVGMPSTAFVSPDGVVARLWSGFLTADQLQGFIDEELLAANP